MTQIPDIITPTRSSNVDREDESRKLNKEKQIKTFVEKDNTELQPNEALCFIVF